MIPDQETEAGQAAAAQLHASTTAVQGRMGGTCKERVVYSSREWGEGGLQKGPGGGGNGGSLQREGGILGELVVCWSSCRRWQALASDEVQSRAGRCCLYLLLPPPADYKDSMPRFPIRTTIEQKPTLHPGALS